MIPCNAKDFICFDSLLSDEEKEIRNMAREFLSREILKDIGKYFTNGIFPMHIMRRMAELGFFGANLQGYGCAGINNVAYGLLMQELEACDSGLRSFASVQSALVMWPIYTFGSAEQKSHWLPLLAQGKAIGCFGLTEPGFGSNPGGMLTHAIRDGDHWILNGEKTWITNGSIADIAIIWAKDVTDQKIKGFIVEKEARGFTTSDIHGKWSLRASITSSLVLSDCRIPLKNLLPGATQLSSALQCLTQARYGIGWGCIGAAKNCFETALEYTLTRKQFDEKPIASHQLVQSELVWMLNEIVKAELLAFQIARLKDMGCLNFAQVSMLKKNNAWMALEVARKSRDLLGANGITGESPIMRHIMNLETVKTYEGTDNIHTLIIGNHITGIPAYS